MKTIQINKYPISYIEEGKGSPVILIHGSISDYRIWENQMEPFAKHFHVIAYSRRYHYPYSSSEFGSDYEISQHSKDLASFIKALDVGAVNIVGSSYGAYTGLVTALKEPDLVKALVLGEPPVIPLIISDLNNPVHLLKLLFRDFSKAISFLKFGISTMAPAKKQLEKGNLKKGARLFTDGVLGKGGFDQLPDEAKECIMDNITALKAELNGPGFPEEFPQKEARELSIPTLLLYAAKSPDFFHAISDRLSELLPNARKLFISNASHDMHAENPKAYNEKVLEFLFMHNYSTTTP